MQTIIILGMHRSGTSCLTGCLQQMGLNLRAVSNFNEYNLKGNKEDDSIAILNEKILNYNGGSWRNPPVKMNWTKEHEEIRDTILENYAQLPSPTGFKDPRMLFTLPFWLNKIANYDFIGTFRHPVHVAQSLYARKNIRVEIADGYKLWNVYNQNLIRLQKTYGFNLMNFDLSPKDYLKQLLSTTKKLNLEQQTKSLNFFDNSLRNQQSASLENLNCPEEVLITYHELLAISDSSLQDSNALNNTTSILNR
jgi:hypothetical protein